VCCADRRRGADRGVGDLRSRRRVLSGLWGGVDLGEGVGADRPRDLPCGGGSVSMQWRRRRWRCRTVECLRQTFTEQVVQVPAGMRTTCRLRVALAEAVGDGHAQSEVAATHGVSWPTVARALVAHARSELAEPEPTTVLGMDEVRFGRVRWLPDGVREDGTTWWRRSDPWEIGFVDLAGDQGERGWRCAVASSATGSPRW
jgi:hypothetical protein